MPNPSTVELLENSESDWVEAAKYRAVMQGMRASQMPALAVIVLLSYLMQPHVPAPVFLVWLVLSLGVALARVVVSARFIRTLAKPLRVQLAYARRHRWTWIASAAAWGLSPMVFWGRLPGDLNVIAWAIVSGVGAVAVTWISAHPRVTRVYLGTMLAGLIASGVVNALLRADFWASSISTWGSALLLIYWVLLFRMSRGLHEMYAQSIDLSYHNARLIHSLQEQTRAAQEASRFKDRFLAGAAHDLKQPVNALGIYAEWLSNEPELVHELGPKILQSTQAINALFDSLFDLVKLDAGQIVVSRRSVDVEALLTDLEVQFGPLARQKGLTLRVRALPVTVVSDPILLRRILGNLVANAIRYTVQGGVLLAARRRGGTLAFEVWDSGIGIAAHEQEQIFGEFYKVKSGGTEEGFGLGLAIVRRLSDQLGCRITMRSGVGRGSMFRLELPAEAPPTAPPSKL